MADFHLKEYLEDLQLKQSKTLGMQASLFLDILLESSHTVLILPAVLPTLRTIQSDWWLSTHEGWQPSQQQVPVKTM